MVERDLLSLIRKAEEEANNIINEAYEKSKKLKEDLEKEKISISKSFKEELENLIVKEKMRIEKEFEKTKRDFSLIEEKEINKIRDSYLKNLNDVLEEILSSILEK